jgi:hypothetical protein
VFSRKASLALVVAVATVTAILTGCAPQGPFGASDPTVPGGATTGPSAEPSPTATTAPVFVEPGALAAVATSKPFGDNCASVFTTKDIATALGGPVKDVSKTDDRALFTEKFAFSVTGTLVCSWNAKKANDFAWFATAYVFDEGLVPFPGKSSECNTGYINNDTTDAGRCFFNFESGGLWASVTLFRADKFDEKKITAAGSHLATVFANRAVPSARAGVESPPAGMWPRRDSCDDFSDVDFSAITPTATHTVARFEEQGLGEANGRVLALAAAGGISCDILPIGKQTDYSYGSFWVLPGMASALDSDVPLEGKVVDVVGADHAQLLPYPDIFYVVTSGPNLIVARIQVDQGSNQKAERAIVAQILAAAKAG